MIQKIKKILLLELEADRMRSIQTKTHQEKPRSWCEGHIFLKSHFLALKDRHGLQPVKARLPISRSIVPLEGNQVFHFFKCNTIGSYYTIEVNYFYFRCALIIKVYIPSPCPHLIPPNVSHLKSSKLELLLSKKVFASVAFRPSTMKSQKYTDTRYSKPRIVKFKSKGKLH